MRPLQLCVTASAILRDAMRNQCDVMVGASTYAAPHRCLKKGKKIGGRRLCPHHLRMEHIPPLNLKELAAAGARLSVPSAN